MEARLQEILHEMKTYSAIITIMNSKVSENNRKINTLSSKYEELSKRSETMRPDERTGTLINTRAMHPMGIAHYIGEPPKMMHVAPRAPPDDRKGPDKDPTRNLETFEEFSGNTTLHGLRFIGDRSSILPRRLFWVLLVMLCVTLFTLQVYDRFNYLLDSPTTVNFKIEYPDTVVFPSITICNQNNFRISKAYEGGWLDFLHELYENDDDILSSSDANLNTSVSELFEGLAHTKEDFILKCQWADEVCSAANFTTTLTNNGVCFSFNKVVRPQGSLIIKASGVEHALRLTLNTENYEHTTGPHSSTGIKMVMTDQHEVPRAEEVGLALSTGIHAFVAISVLTLNNLEPPYGECGEEPLVSTESYDKYTCLLECETRYAYSTCGCRHFYMPDLTGDMPVCTVRQLLTCLQKVLDNFNNVSQALCTCPIPCLYNIYEHSVSYAITSDLESDVGDGVNMTLFKDRFFAATEISTTMNERLHGTFNATLVVAKQNVEQMITDLRNQFYAYVLSMAQIIADVAGYVINHARANITNRYWSQDYIIEDILTRDRDERLETIVVCHDYVSFIGNVEDQLEHLAEFNQDDLSVAKHIYMSLVSYLDNKQYTLSLALETYTELIDDYVDEERFNKAVLDSEQEDAVAELESLLETANQSISNMSMSIRSLEDYAGFVWANTLTQTDDTRINEDSMSFQDACELLMMTKRNYSLILEKQVRKMESKIAEADIWYRGYETSYKDLFDSARFLQSFLTIEPNSTLPSLLEELIFAQKYLNGEFPNVTKYDIAETNSFGAKLNVIQAYFDNIEIKTLELDPLWENMVLSIGVGFVHHKLDAFNEFQEVQDALNQFVNRIESLSATSAIETSDQQVQALQSVADVINNLEAHQAEHMMDEEFYRRNLLQVAVYFKELRSEEIAQQKDYDEISLVCDIGGATGLFIGGSVMTVFEITEFIIMCLVCKVFCKKAKICSRCKVAPKE